MKRLIAALSAAFLLLASTAALADGYSRRHSGFGPGYGHGRDFKSFGHGRHGFVARHHFRGHRHGSHGYGAAVAGALVGGVVLGHVLSRPAYAAPTYYAPTYYTPPAQPILRDCRPTTGIGYYNGRQAEFGGTMCYDRYGRTYIVTGSEHFIGYLR